jgi:transcriptional regulator with XRE-family HTH domain
MTAGSNNTRRVLGQLVTELMARQGLDRITMARRAEIGRTTLWRLTEGEPVTVETVQAVEAVLGQPWGLFRFVIEGNGDAVAALPGLDGDVRTWIISALGVRPGAASKSPREHTA